MDKNHDDDIYIFNNEGINDIKEDATLRSAKDPLNEQVKSSKERKHMKR